MHILTQYDIYKVNFSITRLMSTGPPFLVATIGSPCAAA